MNDYEEMFETYSANGEALGLQPRSHVHATGLWHKAANIFLFRSNGRLVLQQRQISKDVCPGLWDLSVAEHLQPGESYEEGAIRGLKEELGVSNTAVTAIGDPIRATLELPALKIIDRELQQTFHASSDTELSIDYAEVQETREVSESQLRQWVNESPEAFTPWFMDAYRQLNVFQL